MFSAAKIAAPTSSGYNLTNSLRFRASASAYLTQTPAADSSRTTWTYSTWIKRGQLGTRQSIFACYDSANTRGISLEFQTNNQLAFYTWGSWLFSINIQTNQVFTDPSAWYHIVLAVDTTQATSSNTIKLYVNGSQVTSLSASTYPAQNSLLFFSTGTIPQLIGQRGAGSFYYDGYTAETNFVTGQQLTPTSFGSFNATTGVWQPAKYSGTYGTNGFYLPFSNTASTTTLGYDFSGNSNNWTTNNISLTAGSTYDSMTDVPTLTSATASNYAVLSPVDNSNNGVQVSLTDGNLTFSVGAGQGRATFAVSSGKWYWEMVSGATNQGMFGVITPSTPIASATFSSPNGYFYWASNGQKFNNGTGTSYGSGLSSGDVLGIALDCDNGTLTYYKNGTSLGVAFSGLAGIQFAPAYCQGNTLAQGAYNFGQRPFTYTPPTGFVALNAYNLPTGTILQGNKYMDATLYTGNGSTQSIVNAGAFQPDLVWAKSRSSAYSNALTDSNRGVTHILYSDLTNAEATSSTGQDFTSFNSNGFSVGTPTNANSSNASGNSIVAWQWKANGAAVSNTNGSITSQVSANTTAGFSVVTYTGNSTASTVGHGLGVAPSMIFVKGRTNVSDWRVYHVSVTLPLVLNLDNTSGSGSDSGAFGSTAPTSSVFTLGTGAGTNSTGNTYVAYCWAAIAGFSAFGTYTGNGGSQFVYTGFQPKYILIKNTGGGDWYIWDTARNTYNTGVNSLYADTNAVEATSTGINVLANGFVPIVNNSSGSGYIYAAFASTPFRNSLAF